MTNHSFYGADRQTHRRVVLVGMAAAMLVSALIAGISSSTAGGRHWQSPMVPLGSSSPKPAPISFMMPRYSTEKRMARAVAR